MTTFDTCKQFAARTNISVSLCRKLIKNGTIPTIRIGEKRLVIPVELALAKLLAQVE